MYLQRIRNTELFDPFSTDRMVAMLGVLTCWAATWARSSAGSSVPAVLWASQSSMPNETVLVQVRVHHASPPLLMPPVTVPARSGTCSGWHENQPATNENQHSVTPPNALPRVTNTHLPPPPPISIRLRAGGVAGRGERGAANGVWLCHRRPDRPGVLVRCWVPVPSVGNAALARCIRDGWHDNNH